MDEDTAETEGDVAVTRMSLRGGGWIGYSDDALFVDDGERRVKVDREAVTTISLRTVEWDLAVMSVLLVGVGTFVAVTRNTLVGIAFGAVGVWSAYRTYDDRNELVIEVQDRPKPLSVHPVEPKECHETLADAVGLETVTSGA